MLTVLARLAGFGRTLVFAWAVGDNDLGDIYFAANLIPNIVFEIVAGGALASLVVPLLAGAIAAGDRAAVARTTAALLTWAMTLLIPLAIVMALGARPIVALLSNDADPEQVAAGARMLQIFAPQLPLYGVGIVLTGVLQAHRRFAWPVLAPLLSSLTVAAAYFGFTLVDGRGAAVAELSTAGLLVLAVGTTIGVVVLAGVLVPPVLRLRVWAPPTWRFDPAARRRVAGLAGAGAVTVAAQHVALLVVLWRGLAGPEGSWVLFTLAQTVFLLPWAVLAVPLATAAYPGLAETAATGAQSQYGELLARSTRAVLLLSLLGAAGLAAVSVPVAALLAALMPAAGPESVARLAAGIAGFAPALVGYGLFALLSRALYARGETRAVASAALLGWAAVAGAAVALSALLPDPSRVLALTVANSVGMTVLGLALLLAVGARAGRPSLVGVGRAAAAGGLGAVLAGPAGLGVAWWLTPVTDPPTAWVAVGSGMLTAAVVVAVYTVVVWLVDRRDLRPLTVAMVRRLRRPGVDASGNGGA